MVETPPRAPRQPKLRSSCDGCGSAKLKCDRGQPECGRCITLGVPCVYGVSRKMGKPPRERVKLGAARTPGRSTTPGGGHRPSGHSHGRRAGSSVSDTSSSRSNSTSSGHDAQSPWAGMPDYTNTMPTNINMLDTITQDQPAPSLTAFPALNNSDWASMNNIWDDFAATSLDAEPLPMLGWPELGGSPTPTAHSTVPPMMPNDAAFLEPSLMPADDSIGHDCSREAYDILGSLSFMNPSATTSAPGATSPNRPSLDFILHLNREASERLGRLLSCPCANNPNLAFLYASIISRVLVWYCREAGCAKPDSLGGGGSPDSALALGGGMSSSPPSTNAGFGGSPGSSWPSPSAASSSSSGSSANTTTTTCMTSTTTTGSPPTTNSGPADHLAPLPMSMGCFSIDDQRVQAAMRLQLLLGETKRVGGLLDLFGGARCSGSGSGSGADDPKIESLYKSLGAWLAGEHASILEMMRAKLKDLTM
ncbi:hypothetical protein F4780DRAFT_587554 [Xylariomycetidae sp. FL0641]|nr:hypothetical protein F4780DRAFT_587554 [Xylariomycetidae sp. FL0641]